MHACRGACPRSAAVPPAGDRRTSPDRWDVVRPHVWRVLCYESTHHPLDLNPVTAVHPGVRHTIRQHPAAPLEAVRATVPGSPPTPRYSTLRCAIRLPAVHACRVWNALRDLRGDVVARRAAARR